MQLTNEVKTIVAHAPVAAGATDVTDATVIDMQNFEGCRFIVVFGALTAGAVTGIRVQQAAAKTSDTALTSGADLEGSAVSIADSEDGKALIVDVYKPRERYLQVQIDRATQNAVVEAVIAEQYGPRKHPVTKDATVASQEVHISPAEGTA